MASLVLGMAGQVAYHLLSEAGARHAPWGITTAMSCLPVLVLVLGMGIRAAHMVRGDAHAAAGGTLTMDQAVHHPADQVTVRPDRHAADQDRSGHADRPGPTACADPFVGTVAADRGEQADHLPGSGQPGMTLRLVAARQLRAPACGCRAAPCAGRTLSWAR
jgi:hypothetical protein